MNEWKDAVINRLVILGLLNDENMEDPEKALNAIEVWNWKTAEYFKDHPDDCDGDIEISF